MTEAKSKNLDFESFHLLASVVDYDSFNLLWDPIYEKLQTLREKSDVEKMRVILRKLILGFANNNASFTEMKTVTLIKYATLKCFETFFFFGYRERGELFGTIFGFLL